MSLTLSLQPELEAWLQQEATREGVTPAQVVTRALDAQRFAVAASRPPVPREKDLLLQINQGFTDAFWSRFRDLQGKLESETLTETERQEFSRLYAQVEGKNSERMALLAQLAAIRGVALPEVMQQLGVGPIQVPPPP